MRLDLENYSAEIADSRISIFLDNRRYTWLKVGSALDSVTEHDLDQPLGEPVINEVDGITEIVWATSSNLWNKKTYRWRFEPDHFSYQVELQGQQVVRELRYFDGAAENQFGWSFFDFSRFFSPECTLLDQRYYKSMQYGCIDASSGPMSDIPRDHNDNNHWIFTPPPLCYSLGFSSGRWLGAGVAPEQGEYNFSRFEYIPGMNSYCFRLTYDGMTTIDGKWTSPRFVFFPADDEYSTIGDYCDYLRDQGLVNPNTHEQADWWRKPIFCGWGEQNVTVVHQGGGSSQSLARQSIYDGFLSIIKEKDLKPGTLVIDDKWQKHYGTCEVDTEKWPNLRAWIDERHAEGYKVLLWFGAWNSEGLGQDDVILKDGNPVCVDPTSRSYQTHIKEMMHRMLSSDPGCYNADGIKYDWTNSPCVGEEFQVHGKLWGIELLKSLTKQIYDASKTAKSDALMITHTANPYFSECADMIRLNDIFVGCREIVDMMTHRQQIARLACPHAPIDCDNSSAPDHTEWLSYTRMQPELGVPSLYFLTGFDGTLERITDNDWDILAPIWRDRKD